MAIGINGLADDLTSPRLIAGDAPGGYERLLSALRDLRDESALLEPLEEAWRDRAFFGVHSRPLLILAAWRFHALSDPDHPLAPEVLSDAEAPELEARVREALSDPALVATLATRSVQTNEPGRALAWGLVAMSLELPHRGFALADLGASAGLNLVVDRAALPLRFGVEKVSTLDFPSPRRRLGLDPEPLDVAVDAEAVRWLRACIWPGQPERIERFEACVALYQKAWEGTDPGPELRRHRLGEMGTATVLAELDADLPGHAVLAFESAAQPYLAEDVAVRYRADLEGWLRGDARRLWVTLNPAPPGPSGSGGGPMAAVVHFARGGELVTLELARCSYHPSGCTLVPGAVSELRARWSVGG